MNNIFKPKFFTVLKGGIGMKQLTSDVISGISEKRTNNLEDTDVIEDYSELSKEINIYEINGPLYFESARRYSEIIEEIGLRFTVLIIRMRHVSFIDQTGLYSLKDTIRIVAHKGIKIVLSGVSKDVKEELLKNKITDYVSKEMIFNNFSDAVAEANKYVSISKG